MLPASTGATPNLVPARRMAGGSKVRTLAGVELFDPNRDGQAFASAVALARPAA